MFFIFIAILAIRECGGVSPSEPKVPATARAPAITTPVAPSPTKVAATTPATAKATTALPSPTPESRVTATRIALTPTVTMTPLPRVLEAPTPEHIGQAAISTELISRKYEWTYRGSKWTWDLNIPQALYDYYKALPRSPTRNYAVYVTHPLQDIYIKKLADNIQSAAQKNNYGLYQTVEFAVSFVQSLPYTSDLVTEGYDEYPRYPAETLVDNGGDCEDTAILMASLLRAMNYDVVLLGLPSHMAVGVAGGSGISGTYWEYNGRKYYYLETTGTGWKIGQIPDEYKLAKASIYVMTPVPILDLKWKAITDSLTSTINIEVTNMGSADAAGVSVLAAYDAGGGMVWNQETSDAVKLGVSEKVTVTLYPRVPSGKHTRLLIQLFLEGRPVLDSYSEWFDT